MSDIVIKVEDLYKEYILGVIGYGSLKADFASWWARIRGKEDPNSIIGQGSRFDKKNEHFLALRGVSFEVKHGEAVGIIGKNGAGKSTLLKILSRITAPTKGCIKIKGRISSLLEVGTGFHPELTGRENIYLNGAILGMKKKEIDKKLDEIIAFSGIEKFIDTPVKRYSSGMYVRLAFSVAAHLDSDILILDEVLAVGDAEFQKKCLGKMDDVTKNQGRTILFVSHNMGAVRNLCNRAIFLKEGKIEFDGDVEEGIKIYNEINQNKIFQRKVDLTNKIREKNIKMDYFFEWVEFDKDIYNYDDSMELTIKLGSKYDSDPPKNIVISTVISNKLGVDIYHLTNPFINKNLLFHKNKMYKLKIEKLNLPTGIYDVRFFMQVDGIIQDWIFNACFFEVIGYDKFVFLNQTYSNNGCSIVNFDYDYNI